MCNINLSIIIPVYNVEKYLTQCLESLIELNIKDYEIIIVNDGSTDNSKLIINNYVNRYPYIKCIEQHNCGLSIARNNGLSEATGKFVVFIDSDDYINRNIFVKLVNEVLYDDVEIGIANFERLINNNIKKNYRQLFQRQLLAKKGVVSGTEYIKKSFDYLRDEVRVESVTQIYKRSFLEDKNIIFQPHIVFEDTLFTIKAYLNSQNVKYYPYVFYVYRMREGSIMHTISEKSYESIWFIVQMLHTEITMKKINNLALDSLLVNLIYEANKGISFRENRENIEKAKLILKSRHMLTIKAMIKRKILMQKW